MKSIVFKTSLIIATVMIVLMIIIGIFINNKQNDIIGELQNHQKQYIVSQLDRTSKLSIKKSREYLKTILYSVSGGLAEALYNMNDDMLNAILKKLLISVNSIKCIDILDINTHESYIVVYKENQNIISSSKLPKKLIKDLDIYKIPLIYQNETLGSLIVYFDDKVVKEEIELLKQKDLKNFNLFVKKVNQKIKEELILQIIVLLVATLFIISLIIFLLYTFVKKPLNLFQNGLESFFNYLSNPSSKLEKIEINTNDEFGQMTKSVNESIKVSVALHKELKNSKSKLQLLNKSLENKIEERTKELEHQKQYLEVFFKNEGVGILIVDKNRTNIKVNPKLCKMWGYSEDEIIGKNASIFHLSKESYTEFGKIAFEQVKQKNHIDIEYKFQKKNGDQLWARFYGEFINNEHVLWVIEDITKQKEYQIYIEESKKHIEKIHKKIKDSIQFASLIQQAILPQEDMLKRYTNDYFTIWKPKDVVGGDIYFTLDLEDTDELIIMVIDGAGHGVAGAFVTMLVKAIEKQIHAELNASSLEKSPAKILEYFNRSIKTMLKQEKGAKSNAGFDGGILYYNKSTKECKFSGAKTDLYIIEDDKLTILNGDNKHVGFVRTKMTQQYTEYSIILKEDTKLYISTDGLFDQEGENKSRYGVDRFEELILSISNNSFETQSKMILESFNNFKQDISQTDDITILGINFK